MRKAFLIACLGLLLAGCKVGHASGDMPTGGDTRYWKDTRKNLCFMYIGTDDRSNTWVPCTPEVERDIQDYDSRARD